MEPDVMAVAATKRGETKLKEKFGPEPKSLEPRAQEISEKKFQYRHTIFLLFLDISDNIESFSKSFLFCSEKLVNFFQNGLW
jgi:hypothetical protein